MDPTATSPVQPTVNQPAAASVQPQVVVPQPNGAVQQQTQVSPSGVPVAQPQPQAVTIPVGGKEHEAQPIVAVTPSHPEVVLPKEVKEAGVQVETATDQEIRFTQAQKAAGISASGPAIPPEPVYTMPLTEEKVQEVLKAPKYMESITWLATLIKRILLQQRG